MDNIFRKDKEDRELRCNGEGYRDGTAYNAIKNIEREEERYKKLMTTIVYICKLAGFKVQGRIVVQDKNSGRIWK